MAQIPSLAQGTGEISRIYFLKITGTLKQNVKVRIISFVFNSLTQTKSQAVIIYVLFYVVLVGHNFANFLQGNIIFDNWHCIVPRQNRF